MKKSICGTGGTMRRAG